MEKVKIILVPKYQSCGNSTLECNLVPDINEIFSNAEFLIACQRHEMVIPDFDPKIGSKIYTTRYGEIKGMPYIISEKADIVKMEKISERLTKNVVIRSVLSPSCEQRIVKREDFLKDYKVSWDDSLMHIVKVFVPIIEPTYEFCQAPYDFVTFDENHRLLICPKNFYVGRKVNDTKNNSFEKYIVLDERSFTRCFRETGSIVRKKKI